MKGVVLTGGKGSRLRPFTYSGAKQLVPIGNTPVLHFAVRQMVECGITEIALVVGETEVQVRDAMGDGGAFGARFTYIRQEAPLGIAHALGLCRTFAAGEPVVLYLGDNVLVGGISGFVERFRQSSAAASVVLKEVADPRAFGVAVIEGERLISVVEKPASPPSNLAVIGVYAFREPVFDVIAALSPSARGEYEIADAINGLLHRGHLVDTTVTAEHWIDTGKMEDMLAANRVILDQLSMAAIPPAANNATLDSGPAELLGNPILRNVRVIGPVSIADGARVEDSTVGPYVSLGPGCVVRDSCVENAIILENALVERCPRLRDSMIGRSAVVNGAPAGARLTLGDHSRFEMP